VTKEILPEQVSALAQVQVLPCATSPKQILFPVIKRKMHLTMNQPDIAKA
jgi:hypothetical protein